MTLARLLLVLLLSTYAHEGHAQSVQASDAGVREATDPGERLQTLLAAGEFEAALDVLVALPADVRAPLERAHERLPYVISLLQLGAQAVASGRAQDAERLLTELRAAGSDAGWTYRHGLALREERLRDELVSQSVLRTLRSWFFGLLVLAGLWSAFRLLKKMLARFPHPHPRLEIEEPADAHSRPAREMVELLLAPTRDAELLVDTLEDLDRSGLSNIALRTQDIDPLKEIVSSSERIVLWGLSFTPQQLLSFLLPLRRPAARELTGTLTRTESGGARLALRLKQQGALSYCLCEGESRAQVLAEGADFVAFSLASFRVSESWPSFRDYRKALRLLSSTSSRADDEAWFQIRALLESAITFDPRNLAGKYQLGVLLRRLGENAEAASMLEQLHDTLVAEPKPPWVSAFLTRNPALVPSVTYDRALCFAKQGGEGKLARARGLFEQIRGVDARQRLGILAQGGLAALLAAQAASLPRDQSASTARRKLYDEVLSIREQLEASRHDPALEDPRACSSALAVALAAEGRVLYLLGQLRLAESALRSARAENPLLACAAVHLAQVCSKLAKEGGSTLIDEALALLERALALSPKNVRASYLLGSIQLYHRHDAKQALLHLERARSWGRTPTPTTDLVYAEALERTGKTHEAIDVLAHSLRTNEEPLDYRYERFLDLLAGVTDAQEPGWREKNARLAERSMKRLQDGEVSAGLLARSQRYLEQIRARHAAEPAR